MLGADIELVELPPVQSAPTGHNHDPNKLRCPAHSLPSKHLPNIGYDLESLAQKAGNHFQVLIEGNTRLYRNQIITPDEDRCPTHQ
jgi:hypothetical protein